MRDCSAGLGTALTARPYLHVVAPEAGGDEREDGGLAGPHRLPRPVLAALLLVVQNRAKAVSDLGSRLVKKQTNKKRFSHPNIVTLILCQLGPDGGGGQEPARHLALLAECELRGGAGGPGQQAQQERGGEERPCEHGGPAGATVGPHKLTTTAGKLGNRLDRQQRQRSSSYCSAANSSAWQKCDRAKCSSNTCFTKHKT